MVKISEEINIKFYDPEVEELRKENQQLKENNLSYQEEMCRSWKKVDKYKSVLDEIREFIKKCSFSIEGITNEYHDIVYAEDIEEILDKVKE